MKASEALAKIRERFPNSNLVFVVGGTARDILLGREPKDVDLFVLNGNGGNAWHYSVAIAKEVGGKVSVHHRSINCFPFLDVYRIVVDGKILIDVAGENDSRRASKFHQGLSQTDLVREDLSRRDFTVNAMAIPLYGLDNPREHAIDYTEDIDNKVIRALDFAVFQKDAVRILRAFRLREELDGFRIYDDTKADICRDSLRYLKDEFGERIGQELLKIFAIEWSDRSIREMVDWHVMSAIFGNLVFEDCTVPVASMPVFVEGLDGVLDNSVGFGETGLALLRLALMLCNNPVEDVRAGLNRIRLSNKAKKLIIKAVQYSNRDLLPRMNMSPHKKRDMHRYCRETGDYTKEALILMMARRFVNNEPLYRGVVADILAENEKITSQGKNSFLSGLDVVEMGFRGPAIRAVLDALAEAEAVGEISSYEEALNLIQRARKIFDKKSPV